MSPDPSNPNGDETDRTERAGRSEFTEADLIEAVKRLSVGRRSMLKALGVGAAASLASGGAAADAPSDGSAGPAADHVPGHPQRIDPYYGYSSPSDETLPSELRPDHEVDCLISFPGEGEARPPYFYFDPVGLHVQPGDVVRFNLVTPEHGVTVYHPGFGRQQRVPDGVPPISSPMINAGGFWLYEFTETGLYDAFCPPHEIFGMVVRVLVGDPEPVPDWEDTFAGPGRPPEHGEALAGFLGVAEWPFLAPADVLGADALDPANLAAEGSVAWSDVTAELLSGGGNGEPTNYQVDFVAGDPIEELGEDGLYAEQDRLLRYAWGTTEEGITDRGSAWASAEVRDCLADHGHIVSPDGGDTAQVTFTVADGCELALSLAVHSLPGGEFSVETADQQELLNATTETYGPGEHTISVDLP